MRTLGLPLLVLLAFGCGSSDITDDPQIDLTDAGIVPLDADQAAPDANDLDASATADAAVDRAQIFCDRYQTLCGYDPQNTGRYADEAECLTTFDALDGAQQSCVEDELDLLASDSNLSHCRSAMGRPPCN